MQTVEKLIAERNKIGGRKFHASKPAQQAITHLCAMFDQLVPFTVAERAPETLPERVISTRDSFCPGCGHNRDASSVSSIDEGGGYHSCQMCGTLWREEIIAQGPSSTDLKSITP